jgi:hypothetical protein
MIFAEQAPKARPENRQGGAERSPVYFLVAPLALIGPIKIYSYHNQRLKTGK